VRARRAGGSPRRRYAEYLIAPASAVARMPADLSPVESAPLLCAGLIRFNALRNSGARPGDVVAVLGLGGLGHLAVQYAAKMGFHVVGIARGTGRQGSMKKSPGGNTAKSAQSQSVRSGESDRSAWPEYRGRACPSSRIPQLASSSLSRYCVWLLRPRSAARTHERARRGIGVWWGDGASAGA
jgi:Zn-dependent alcohol dehydrogenase